MQGRVVKGGVIFDERIVIGRILQERAVQNPTVQDLMVQGRYGKAITQSRVVEGLLVRYPYFQILNIGKILLVGRRFML